MFISRFGFILHIKTIKMTITITKENFAEVMLQIAEMLKEKFPKVKMVYADTVNSPEIAGQNSVFAVPTIITYMGGREYFRKSRNIGIGELKELINRPYQMIFNEN